jgi:hypothetical protein
MVDAWMLRLRRLAGAPEPAEAATARFGGDGGDEPVLVGTVNGPLEAAMAKEALAEANIPAYVKQNSLGPIYGLSIGTFGAAEIWTMPVLAEQARATLRAIGLLEAIDGDATSPATPNTHPMMEGEQMQVRLGDVLSLEIMATNYEHIRDFVVQEGITPDPDDLSATQVTERQLKELLAELADDLDKSA